MTESILGIIAGILSVAVLVLRRYRKTNDEKLVDAYENAVRQRDEQEREGRKARDTTKDMGEWTDEIRRKGF